MPRSISSRLIALLTVLAVAIVSTGMVLDYRYSRGEILAGLELESRQRVQAVTQDLDNWLRGVEGATRFLGQVLEQEQQPEAQWRALLRSLVANNSEIFGAAIALEPAEDGSGAFADYFFRDEGTVTFVDLAAQGDYRAEAWYADAVAGGTPRWSEPYLDRLGAGVTMTTYSVPVYRYADDGSRSLLGVVTADVRLQELQAVLRNLHLGDSGYSLLLSREGVLMSARNEANLMRHYSEVIADPQRVEAFHGWLQRALAGEVVAGEVPCPELAAACTMRLGTLASTGWPLALVFDLNEVLAPLHDYQLRTATISLATLTLLALAVFLVVSRLTRPLRELSAATVHIARGDFDVPLPAARGRDEVARLVQDFAAMRENLGRYLADLEQATTNRVRLESELAAAREIQMSMLPGSGELLLSHARDRLWAQVVPARSVGGDFYFAHPTGERLLLAVGDVSDKGIPAALFMARTLSLLQQLGSADNAPGELLATLNEALVAGNDNCMFVTLCLGILDVDSGELRFASAGHCPPLLLRDGVASDVAQDSGPALGLAGDQQFPPNVIRLEAGDRLAIYSDGLEEAFNADGEMFGLARIHDALAVSGGQAPDAAGAALLAAVAGHRGDADQSDDITLLLIDYRPASQRLQQAFTLQPGVVSRVHAWLDTVLAGWGIAAGPAGELKLVAEELVANVCHHAGLPATASLEIALAQEGEVLAMELQDSGKPFDPLREARRAALGEESVTAEVGGLGVHLVTGLTERQHYRREGDRNILRVELSLASR